MKYKLGITLAITALAGFALVGPGVADSGFKNKYPDTTASKDCGDGDSIDYAGPLKMWPPNHKLQDVQMSATDGPSSNPADAASNQTTLTVTVSPLDAVGGDGGPQHDPDFFYPNGPSASGDPTATVPFQLRSERSGKGDGRTYDVHSDATFDGGMKRCSWDMQVVVPHDMSGGANG